MESDIENVEKQKELIFECSVEAEARRIQNTLGKKDWFEKQGYPWKKFNYPKGINVSKIESGEITYTEEDLKKLVESEFDEESYTKVINSLEEGWDNISDTFKAKMSECSLVVPKNYKIVISKYGTGGSYWGPNIIYINITNRSEKSLLGLVVHEGIHLSIEDMIIKHGLSQWQKERIVDLTVEAFFPGLKEMQRTKIDTKEIDEIYKNNHPDIETIIKKVGELNSKND